RRYAAVSENVRAIEYLAPAGDQTAKTVIELFTDLPPTKNFPDNSHSSVPMTCPASLLSPPEAMNLGISALAKQDHQSSSRYSPRPSIASAITRPPLCRMISCLIGSPVEKWMRQHELPRFFGR